MIAFGHTAIGAAIGLTSYNLLQGSDIAVGLVVTGSVGVISHYIADFIPHGHFFGPSGYKTKILPVIIFDVLLSVILFLGTTHFLGASPEKLLYILFGIGGSQLPDILDGLIYIDLLPKKGIFKIENNFHRLTHWHGMDENARLLGPTDIWQATVVTLSLIYIINF